jgi:hypothetical protein
VVENYFGGSPIENPRSWGGEGNNKNDLSKIGYMSGR